MSKPVKVRKLTLGKYAPEARRVFDLARRLIRGEGPPEELRMPNALVRVVPHTNEEPPKSGAWGVAGVGVALEMRRSYPPIEAMVIAAYILFGIDWPARYKTLRLPASLEQAYIALQQHFADGDTEKPAALVTIAKSKPVAKRRIARLPAVTDQRPAAPVLPAPEQPRLTHQPTVKSEESLSDIAARRVR